MKKILYTLLLLFVAMNVKAEVVTLEEGVGAAGPGANGNADYKFTATRDGVLSFTTTFTGAYWGTFSIGGETHSLSSSVIVKEGDVALITVACEQDNTSKTITARLTSIKDGMTQETATLLSEGENIIKAMKSGDAALWYKFTAKAQKRSKLTFTGYPTMLAYVGDDLATELGQNNPVDYINNSNEDVTVYVKMSSTNSIELTATLEYLSPVEDLTYFNQPVFSVEDGGTLPQNMPITITFPNRQGGDDSEPVTVSYYIFNVVGSNPNGAPINLGGQTEAKGTLAGVDINYNLTKGRKYQLKIQSLKCGNHYAPSAEEPYMTGDAVIFTVVAADTAIEAVSANGETSTPSFNLAGQRVNANQKGIIIENGRKIVR